MNHSFKLLFSAAALTFSLGAGAQLSSNPDKFLGNITTDYNVDYGKEPFYTLWNQITPENESKWDQIEGQRRGSFNWYNCDKIYDYAKRNGFPFKFHTLIWGSQYPNWMNNLSTAEQYKAIEEWMDAIKARYPDLPMIDVVNEAVAGHAPAPYKAALGGDGFTGYDWIIRAFEMAHERWPDAILIYNDYNTFRWQKTQFIDLVRTLRDAGAPIDAYGCQSHDLTDMDAGMFRAAMDEIQNALRMPMYSTEYDIGSTNDTYQLQRFKEQIPYMWEADYVAGVTLWGYIYGHTWVNNNDTGEKGISGIIKDGNDRPAMTWLREYMQTEAAKKAKSPFPGMVKEASVYVKCGNVNVCVGDEVPITVSARLKTKTIDHIDLYVGGQLLTTMTAEPYQATVSANVLGRTDVKAVVVAADGTQYERWSGFNTYPQRVPYNGGVDVPGTIEFENFDGSNEGITYHDSDSNNEGGTHYRNDGGGVDIVTGNGGYAIGYTAAGEWLDYTVNVTEAGTYSYEAYASSGSTGSGFSIGLVSDGRVIPLAKVSVSQTANNSWDTYKAFTGTFAAELPAGRQTLRVTIDSPYCNLDRLVLKCTAPSGISQVNADDEDAQTPLYNIYGVKVNDQYKGVVIRGGKKYLK